MLIRTLISCRNLSNKLNIFDCIFYIFYSNYQQIQHLAYAGHEIATESISQQQGLQDKGYEEWVGEMIGMREILRHFSNVSVNDVVGMRAPFLKPGRNTQYKVISHLSTLPPNYFITNIYHQTQHSTIKVSISI